MGYPAGGQRRLRSRHGGALEVHQRPRDGACPVVCLDETSKRLISETRVPIPARSGRIARHHYEYTRDGTANLFMLFAPLKGSRRVKITGHHASVDYAQVLGDLADTHFPDARRIVLARDNLASTGGSPISRP